MSKIICDICGTSYADTATQCPICGCVRPAQPQSVPEAKTKDSGYTYVKGGRFSKGNVKKRNATAKAGKDSENKETNKGTTGLLIAIILVGVIALGVILWAFGVFDAFAAKSTTPETTPASTEPSPPIAVPCEGLVIVNKQYTLEQIGDSVLIDCRKLPTESTDEITYTSEDDKIAVVDENGKVTAVQNGTTCIIITCGDVVDRCEITVGDGIYPVDLVLDYENITLTAVGETKQIYTGTIPVDKITWITDNEYIATVSNGVVTAVASGPVTITASYMGKTATCQVLCEIIPTGNLGGITEDGGGIGTDGGNSSTGDSYVIHTQFGLLAGNDASIKVGETLELYLKGASGNRVVTDWTYSGENDNISVTGNVIKALKSTNWHPLTVSTVYEGKTYTCVIRVY